MGYVVRVGILEEKEIMYEDLDDLIKNSPKSSEIHRAIAVKQDLADMPRKTVAALLNKSVNFVSKWRLIYDEYGVNGLISLHQGGASRAFLKAEQRQAVLSYIQSQEVIMVSALRLYIEAEFEVKFKTDLSYHNLLYAAGKSWHKSQKVNPKRDEQMVRQRRQAIKKN
jgi:transposase